MSVQGSAQPLAKKMAGQIEKETDEHRTLNVQRRIRYTADLKKRVNNAILAFEL
jgi:hypothetical protein